MRIGAALQVGMAVEPGGLKDQLVTAAADGELKFIDFRVLGEGNTAGSGGESAFAMRQPSNSGNGSPGKLTSAHLAFLKYPCMGTFLKCGNGSSVTVFCTSNVLDIPH